LNMGMTDFIALSPGRCASANGMQVPTAAMLITPVTLVYPFYSWQIKLHPRPHARKGAMSETGSKALFDRRPVTSDLPR
jgi:hypothetical protein